MRLIFCLKCLFVTCFIENFSKVYFGNNLDKLSVMSLQQLLDHEIFTRSEIAGFPRFKRASFTMNYEGQNTLGNHNGDLTVNFYEPFANENCAYC